MATSPSSSSSPGPFPVFDAHTDSLQRALDLGHDLGTETPGHLDLVRGRRGGLEAVVLACWADPRFRDPSLGGARLRTTRLLAEFHALLARHPDRVQWAGNDAVLEQARAAGRVAAIAGIEGGHSIEESLETLEWFFERGVRVMTLVWNEHLSWVRSCQPGAGPDIPPGLSPFGRSVVERMNELGMLVDLSHAGERSFYDALEFGAQPAIASHSGCRALHDHPRNLSDDQLRALARAGGVVGIVFCTPFLDAAEREVDDRARQTDAYRAIEAEEGAALFFAQADHLQAAVAPLPLERVLDHVMHAVEIAGVEQVGIGSDFDGIQRRPAGLEDASGYPLLAEGLLERGLDRQGVQAVLGGNLRRVFAAATGQGTAAAGAELTPLLAGDPPTGS